MKLGFARDATIPQRNRALARQQAEQRRAQVEALQARVITSLRALGREL